MTVDLGRGAPVLIETEPLDIVEDAFAMRDAAVRDLHALGGPSWTDFNTHDPGITFLDVLSYALADLGYLINSDVADLVTDVDGAIDFERLGLFLPASIFPTSPLSELDYRKVILDEVPHLENVWFIDPEEPFDQLGFRAVRFLMYPGFASVQQTSDAIAACLQRRRALGDFFQHPQAAIPERLTITAEIDDSPTTRTEAMLDSLVLAVQQVLTPIIAFDITSPVSSDSALRFSGPSLSQGYISDDELWLPCPWEVAKQKVTDAVAATLTTFGAGLRQLEVAWVKPASPKPTDPNAKPALDQEASAPTAVYRLDTTLSTVRVHYAVDDAGDDFPLRGQPPRLSAKPIEAPHAKRTDSASLPTGQFLDAAQYMSIQDDLPALYRLTGANNSTVPSESNAQILQLKGYLSVFDQILANMHQRLASTAELLAPRADETNTWTQPIYGVDDVSLLLEGYNSTFAGRLVQNAERLSYQRNPDNPYRLSLRAIASDWCHGGDDRRAILKHLLSRFGHELPPQSDENFETREQMSRWLEGMSAWSCNRGLSVKLPNNNASADAVPSTLEQFAATVLSLPGTKASSALCVSSVTPDANGYTGRAYYIVEHGALLDRDLLPPAAPAGIIRCQAAPSDDVPNGLRVPLTFFAQRATHLLTNWTTRKNTSRFEHYVRSMLHAHLPAHLATDWCWLTAAQMQQFAALYSKWTAAGFAAAAADQRLRCCAEHITIDASGPAADVIKFLLSVADSRE